MNTCFVGIEGTKSTGSVRKDESNLSTEQLAYLGAVKERNAVMAQAPDDEVAIEDDLTAYKNWAAQSANAIAMEIRLLEERSWSPAVAGPVADLVAELRRSLPAWQACAAAADPKSFRTAAASDALDSSHEYAVKVRAALGLATSDGTSG